MIWRALSFAFALSLICDVPPMTSCANAQAAHTAAASRTNRFIVSLPEND